MSLLRLGLFTGFDIQQDYRMQAALFLSVSGGLYFNFSSFTHYMGDFS
jgi:hypothetical protein